MHNLPLVIMLKGCVLSVYTHRFQLMMADMDSNQLRSIALWTATRQAATYLTIFVLRLDAADADD